MIAVWKSLFVCPRQLAEWEVGAGLRPGAVQRTGCWSSGRTVPGGPGVPSYRGHSDDESSTADLPNFACVILCEQKNVKITLYVIYVRMLRIKLKSNHMLLFSRDLHRVASQVFNSARQNKGQILFRDASFDKLMEDFHPTADTRRKVRTNYSHALRELEKRRFL